MFTPRATRLARTHPRSHRYGYRLFLAQVRIIFLGSRVSTLKPLFLVDEWKAFFQDAAPILEWFPSQVRFQRGLKSRSIQGFVPEPPVAHRNQPHAYREVLSTISRELHLSFQRRCVPSVGGFGSVDHRPRK